MHIKKIWRYEALIFMTGAVVLSLEVLSSRIVTPYLERAWERTGRADQCASTGYVSDGMRVRAAP